MALTNRQCNVLFRISDFRLRMALIGNSCPTPIGNRQVASVRDTVASTGQRPYIKLSPGGLWQFTLSHIRRYHGTHELGHTLLARVAY